MNHNADPGHCEWCGRKMQVPHATFCRSKCLLNVQKLLWFTLRTSSNLNGGEEYLHPIGGWKPPKQ